MSTPKNSHRSSEPPHTLGRTQQLSTGGLLVVVIIALLSWWSNRGDVPPLAGQPSSTPATNAPVVLAIPTTLVEPTSEPASVVVTVTESIDLTAPPPAETPAAPATATTTATPVPPTITVTPTASPTRVRPTATATRPAVGVSGLPTIDYADLPDEAHTTIALIDAGGPFPFNRDDTIFQNRERLLPRRPSGYYREYTVITPGADDRGARRIVAGEEGELYYTDDHYDSFREVLR